MFAVLIGIVVLGILANLFVAWWLQVVFYAIALPLWIWWESS